MNFFSYSIGQFYGSVNVTKAFSLEKVERFTIVGDVYVSDKYDSYSKSINSVFDDDGRVMLNSKTDFLVIVYFSDSSRETLWGKDANDFVSLCI